MTLAEAMDNIYKAAENAYYEGGRVGLLRFLKEELPPSIQDEDKKRELNLLKTWLVISKPFKNDMEVKSGRQITLERYLEIKREMKDVIAG